MGLGSPFNFIFCSVGYSNKSHLEPQVGISNKKDLFVKSLLVCILGQEKDIKQVQCHGISGVKKERLLDQEIEINSSVFPHTEDLGHLRLLSEYSLCFWWSTTLWILFPEVYCLKPLFPTLCCNQNVDIWLAPPVSCIYTRVWFGYMK